MALPKCLDRARSGEVDREEAPPAATEVRRDSTVASFPVRCAADPFERGFEPLLDPLDEAAFGRFAFKRIDLAFEDVRLAAFLAGFDLTFAFVTINAATYTGYAS